MDQLIQPLETLMQDRYWRVGLIIGLAVLVALFMRITVLPLLHRLSRKTSSQVDDRVLALVKPAILQTVVLEGFHWAIVDFVSDPKIDSVVHGTVVTILVLLWGRVILGSGTIIFQRASQQADSRTWIQPQTLPLIKFVFRVIVFATQAYLILMAWNINLTSWLASAGVLGIAVGFAAKDTLANFISGVFILVDAPYQVGQYIIVDADTRGIVTEIGMRSTRLLTRDHVEITVPNAVIGNSMVINQSSGPSAHMRVKVAVSVAYGSDIDQVRELLMKCTEDIPYGAKERESSVRFLAMGDSALQFSVRTWAAHPEFRSRVVDTLNTRIYQALRNEGIAIPFPQQDLHIKSWPGPPA